MAYRRHFADSTGNKEEMESRDIRQLIACPKRRATETNLIFFAFASRSVCWIVLLTYKDCMGLRSILSTESPTKSPCVTAANILLAPFSWHAFAADTSVPAVEHISSARSTSFPLTSPINVIDLDFSRIHAMFINNRKIDA